MNQVLIENFWDNLQALVSESQIIIDRPKGSVHPRYPNMVYPLDYGYLQGTYAIDGDGIDLFLGSQLPPRLSGILLTVDSEKKDIEIKLLLGCSASEQYLAAEFLSTSSMGVTTISTPAEPRNEVNSQTELLLKWLSSRRSIRHFSDRSIPNHLIESILEVSTCAPSAHNLQPWRFVVLRSPESRQSLARNMGESWLNDLLSQGLDYRSAQEQIERSNQRIRSAPLAILICLDTTDLHTLKNDHEKTMAIQSVALAGGMLLLAAHACNLGAVWLCAPLFAPQAVHKAAEDCAWEIPPAWQPQALILLGYPAKPARPKIRRKSDETTIFI